MVRRARSSDRLRSGAGQRQPSAGCGVPTARRDVRGHRLGARRRGRARAGAGCRAGRARRLSQRPGPWLPRRRPRPRVGSARAGARAVRPLRACGREALGRAHARACTRSKTWNGDMRVHACVPRPGMGTCRRAKYTWLRNRIHFEWQAWREFAALRTSTLKVARALGAQGGRRDPLGVRLRRAARTFFRRWYFWATHSRLPPMIQTARMLTRHLPHVLTY